MLEILEALMLFCFGFAWPFNIFKSYIARSNKGKSLLFLIVIFIGYIFGILHKSFSSNKDFTLWLYVLNSLFVFVDILLFFRNRSIEKKNS